MSVLRFPSPPDSKEFEAAKRVVATFDAPAALKVASGIVLLASMKLAEKLPGLLALSLHDATQKLSNASALASLYLDDRAEYDRLEAQHRGPR